MEIYFPEPPIIIPIYVIDPPVHHRCTVSVSRFASLRNPKYTFSFRGQSSNNKHEKFSWTFKIKLPEKHFRQWFSKRSWFGVMAWLALCTEVKMSQQLLLVSHRKWIMSLAPLSSSRTGTAPLYMYEPLTPKVGKKWHWYGIISGSITHFGMRLGCSWIMMIHSESHLMLVGSTEHVPSGISNDKKWRRGKLEISFVLFPELQRRNAPHTRTISSLSLSSSPFPTLWHLD